MINLSLKERVRKSSPSFAVRDLYNLTDTSLVKISTEKAYFYDYPELIVYDKAHGQGSAIYKLIDSL